MTWPGFILLTLRSSSHNLNQLSPSPPSPLPFSLSPVPPLLSPSPLPPNRIGETYGCGTTQACGELGWQYLVMRTRKPPIITCTAWSLTNRPLNPISVCQGRICPCLHTVYSISWIYSRKKQFNFSSQFSNPWFTLAYCVNLCLIKQNFLLPAEFNSAYVWKY